jgi:hypothetical protein
MIMRARIVLLAFAIGLAALAGGYAIYWRLAAEALSEGIAQFIDERRAEGYRIEHGEISLGGFPAAIAVRVEAPVAAAPNGRWRWSASAIELRAWPWRPRGLDIELSGRHDIASEGNRISLQAGAASIALALASSPATDSRSNGVGLVLRAADIALLEGSEPALGRAIPEVSIDGVVLGPMRGGKSALGAWRDAGGTLDIGRLRFAWGPLTVEGDGTFALDEAMRPIGAMVARLSGYKAAIDRLVEAGVLSAHDGLAHKVALGAFAQPSPDGEAVAKVPVTLQDGLLYVGPIALAGLPAVE